MLPCVVIGVMCWCLQCVVVGVLLLVDAGCCRLLCVVGGVAVGRCGCLFWFVVMDVVCWCLF